MMTLSRAMTLIKRHDLTLLVQPVLSSWVARIEMTTVDGEQYKIGTATHKTPVAAIVYAVEDAERILDLRKLERWKEIAK